MAKQGRPWRTEQVRKLGRDELLAMQDTPSIMLQADRPALIFAPMEGVADPPMRALQGDSGAFAFAVSEFVRVSVTPVPAKVFLRMVPELRTGGATTTGMPVQVQILGGDPERVALSAISACRAGAWGIDLNFGCPAKTVNRNDGGASLLRDPARLRRIVRAVREVVPAHIPVSAKIRLGWDDPEAVDHNAEMAAAGGASWLTIHARTRVQGYAPPVDWRAVGRVRERLAIPVVANGDIFTLDDFRRCRDESRCAHFMLGRGALADPSLPTSIACELGLRPPAPVANDWPALLRRLAELSGPRDPLLLRMKQWLKLAQLHGRFSRFDEIKRAESAEDLLRLLGCPATDPEASARTTAAPLPVESPRWSASQTA